MSAQQDVSLSEQIESASVQAESLAFEISGLTQIYSPGTAFQKIALDHIDLRIKKGAFIGLIGHTGSGKSTLIQHLNALIKPSDGQILLNGQDVNADKTKLKSIRQKVGLVFQYPEHQLFEMTIAKDVAFGPENMGLPAEEVDRRVRESLSFVGLSEEDLEKSPFELSGGQKRRVAIAGVLAMKPEVLVLDEPTAGLDPKGRDEILTHIQQMHEKLGITVLLVSHSMEDIARYADTVVVMRDGKIAHQGSCAEVFEKGSELEKIGLSTPQITKVVAALREKGCALPKGIYTVEAAAAAIARLISDPSAM
ncbi:MAG: energy-coupling factor transporter ATPase [Clostridiales bacterium]|nr:energy-coupling factor transporter ATPase [Clostridiales bacterium]